MLDARFMRELSVAEQRYQAVLAVIAGGGTVTEVVGRWGVSQQVSATVKFAVVLTAAMTAPASACRSRPNSTSTLSGASASKRNGDDTFQDGLDAANRFFEGPSRPFNDLGGLQSSCHCAAGRPAASTRTEPPANTGHSINCLRCRSFRLTAPAA
jgi:hypothetical protein